MRLTIEKFQYLYALSQLDLPEFDIKTRMVEIYTGLSTAEVDKMKVKKLNHICDEIQAAFSFDEGKPQKFLRANKRFYRVNYEVLTAGKYVDGAQFGKDVIGNLHKILASITTRVNFFGKEIKCTHEERADDLLHVDFKHAYHTAVFFYAVFTKSMINMKDYYLEKAVTKGANPQTVTLLMNTLTSTLAGFHQPKWLRNLNASH
jgi:hypothetical protein